MTPIKVLAELKMRTNAKSNIEIRNNAALSPNHEIPNEFVLRFNFFAHFKLFRISGFDIRISGFYRAVSVE